MRELISVRLSDEFRASLATAADRYEMVLEGGSPALNYLLGRGIEPRAISAYRLGMVNGDIAEHAAFTGGISIPYLTRLGGVVQLKFRRLTGDGPKYMSSGGSPRIYNTMALDKADQLGYVAICEGEFDAIILDAYCAIPAVGIPGVETWASRPEWREMFAGYSRVFMFADPDEPGQKLANRILRDLDTAHLVALPGDVNETYLDKGADFIREVAGLLWAGR